MIPPFAYHGPHILSVPFLWSERRPSSPSSPPRSPLAPLDCPCVLCSCIDGILPPLRPSLSYLFWVVVWSSNSSRAMPYHYPPSPLTREFAPLHFSDDETDGHDSTPPTQAPTTPQQTPASSVTSPCCAHRRRRSGGSLFGGLSLSPLSPAAKPELEFMAGAMSKGNAMSDSSSSSGRPPPPSLQHSYSDSPSSSSPIYGKMLPRRTSRFDPMGREDEEDDVHGYGDLGRAHPLRRVKEEVLEKEMRPGSVTLPSIKSLFGASEHPPTPPASQQTLFHSPSLPALSPSGSPSTARTSRYSSLATVSTGERFSIDAGPSGWWAPDFDRPSPLPPPNVRSNSFPLAPYLEEPDAKRRRSDQPPSFRDTDEAARLRWQAQSRNASFPTVRERDSISAGPSPYRNMLHPPQAPSASTSAMMSRGSFSMSSPGHVGPISPRQEHLQRPPAGPRSASLVGGQLASTFATLRTSERQGSFSDMGPPAGPIAGKPMLERRPFPSPLDDPRVMPRSGLRESFSFTTSPAPPPIASQSQPSSPIVGLRGRRQSLTRPSTPDDRPDNVRRSSLTEMIKARSGDALNMTRLPAPEGVPPVQPRADLVTSVPLQQPSLSESALPPRAEQSEWQTRRVSADSSSSASHSVNQVSLNSDTEGPMLSLRGRKRTTTDSQVDEGENDPGMRGMEMLAESARRVSEEEERRRSDTEHDSKEGSPGKTGLGLLGGPKYPCQYCAKTFSRPSSLRIHTYSHTGERPYVCPEPSCRRRFSVQSNLKRHAKVHQMGQGGPSLSQLQAPPLRGPPGPGGYFGHPLPYGAPPPGPPPPGYPPHPGYVDGPRYHQPPPPGEHHRHPHPHPGWQHGPNGMAIDQQDGWDEEDELEEDELEEEDP